jgi:hypothetical protein
VGRQTTRAGPGGVNPTALEGELGRPRPPTRLGISWYCEERIEVRTGGGVNVRRRIIYIIYITTNYAGRVREALVEPDPTNSLASPV